MNNLTEQVKEFWENLKEAYPQGEQVKAADDLAAFFMEEGPRIEFGEEDEVDCFVEADTDATSDPFATNDLNDFEPDEDEGPQ